MYLICDIDWTLSVVPMDRAVAAATENWDAYYASDFTADEPKQRIVSIVEAWLETGGIAVFVTSRRSTVRMETEEWLRSHLPSMNNRNTELVMRDADDATGEVDWKVEAVHRVCPRPTAGLVIDDNRDVCHRLAEDGYQVLEVL